MHYASFIVRIWLPTEDPTPDEPALRGRIEHVQTGAVTNLTRLDEVTAFIQAKLHVDNTGPEGRPEREPNHPPGGASR